METLGRAPSSQQRDRLPLTWDPQAFSVFRIGFLLKGI